MTVDVFVCSVLSKSTDWFLTTHLYTAANIDDTSGHEK